MANQYDNTNRFILGINPRKRGEKDPDRTGTINIEGVEYYLNGWIGKTAAGDPILTGSVKRKDGQQQKPAPQTHDESPF